MSDAIDMTEFDVVVVGGGPAGATAADDLAQAGRRVLLLDKAGRIKPCGGAVPPKLMEEFAIPSSLLVANITSARMVAPSATEVDMPIDGGYVGMVNRETFDEWLRQRAAAHGAQRLDAECINITRGNDGVTRVHVQQRVHAADGSHHSEQRDIRTKALIGADGARSLVARLCVPGAEKIRYVAAYHEIVAAPSVASSRSTQFDPKRCDVYYQGRLSPDFYGWIFPHGDTVSIGVGSAQRGFSLRSATSQLRQIAGLDANATVRCEGAPIPMKPLPRWDNGRDVVLAGDAAGVVAPASGEGIYYAMTGGRLAARAVEQLLITNKPWCLRQARRDFMRAHGRVFFILGIMQWFWYRSDQRRERFVSMCRDPDVQRLTWQAYMHKRLQRSRPVAHVKIFCKDMAHLLGLARV